jgi:hypothetical protein
MMLLISATSMIIESRSLIQLILDNILNRENNDKVGLKACVKKQDSLHCDLLKKDLEIDDTEKSTFPSPLISTQQISNKRVIF